MFNSPSEGLGALTLFTDRGQWVSAVGTHVTEGFESLPLAEAPGSGGVISTPHFDFIADANHGRIGVYDDGNFSFLFDTPGLSGKFLVGNVHAPASAPPHFNTLSFAQPITAFAANFEALDDGGIRNLRIAGESFEIVPRPAGGSSYSAFFGVVSSTPFTVIDIRNANNVLERFALDDVSFRAVPEPFVGYWLVAALGLLVRRSRAGSRR